MTMRGKLPYGLKTNFVCPLMPVLQGRIQDFGKGGSSNCEVVKRGVFAHMRASFFSLFMKFGGPPKRGGGS